MKDFIFRNVAIVSVAAVVFIAVAATGVAFAVDHDEAAQPLTYMSIPF